MATRLGSKVKKSHSKKPPASAEDPVTVPAEIRGPDRTGDPGEGEGDSSSDEELDTRAMVEEKLRSVASQYLCKAALQCLYIVIGQNFLGETERENR